LNPQRLTVFSTDGVKNLSAYVLDFSVVSVFWSVRVHGSFYGF